MKNPITLLPVIGLVSLLGAGAAFAQPASVVSPNWSLRANNTINIAVDITSQGTVGNCPQIAGTFIDGVGKSDVEGFYCPSTGQISFLRVNPGNKSTGQVYTGQVITLSTNPTVLEMEGTFLSISGANGPYSFEGGNAVVTPPPIQ